MYALSVGELARACGGVVEGDAAKTITGANSLEAAGPEDLSFVANAKAQPSAARSKAGCLIVAKSFDEEGAWSIIRVTEPRTAFAHALTLIYPARHPAASVHPTAVIAASAIVHPDCTIGPYVVVGDGSKVGRGCYLADGVHIGERVSIGDESTLHPHVTIYDGVEIGAHVTLHAGCVIGADGFGFTWQEDHYEKFPQVGTVYIEDDVEIGANCCVDRAALGVTRIGAGSKLDNMVHIGHNCSIGKHVVIAAQTGLAGGVIVEDQVVLGGQVGIGERAHIESHAVLGSKSGVLSFKRVTGGEPLWGIPARPLRQHLRGLANTNGLPKLKDDVRKMERRLAALESVQQLTAEDGEGSTPDRGSGLPG